MRKSEEQRNNKIFRAEYGALYGIFILKKKECAKMIKIQLKLLNFCLNSVKIRFTYKLQIQKRREPYGNTIARAY